MSALISREDLRRQVQAQIIQVMTEAPNGLDAMAAARARFPGTPTRVLLSAYSELLQHREEAWWRQLEDSVNGEVIRQALAKAEGSA